ncbi:MAG: imidazole glycerol phosphate synthase subunit HisH [Thermoplasmata archaeon]|nr:imidazole glycerol phosphate synthase subunit HisH [Thermoplasmata archaeon]
MPLRITLTDYGVGNLYSIKRSLENCGAEVAVVQDMSEVLDAECVVFPGVGAFDRTMEKLQPYREDIRSKLADGTPALGICIGMQILYERSAEGATPGLGFFKGEVVPLEGRIVPHMGWNAVVSDDPLMRGVGDDNFYFAHSFRGSPAEDITVGTTVYEGNEIPTFFRKANTYGTQFHPEKSSGSGMAVLRNFISFAESVL